MKKLTAKQKEIIPVILSLVAVLAAAVELIGKPARLPILITLICGSIGIGISIGVYVERKRSKSPTGNET